ncbi:MAG: aldo/keto reductase [Gracilibacteraceae bacterium]|jgi:predicted aldo/keto reductase-like oxidoreductase|nr:aldo/keto reductase [Gracilibacteraceae bacterium]
MSNIQLGATKLYVEKNGMGCLPIQRCSSVDAVSILQLAFRGGVHFFDTARNYTNSEEKLGLAFCQCRNEVVITSKTHAKDTTAFWQDLKTSLTNLRTGYIDIYMFHNSPVVYRPNDGTGLYEAMLEAKKQGLIRHIGLSTHKFQVALLTIESGLYEVLQYPFSYLATNKEIELVQLSKEKSMGFVAMKALSGGLLKSFSTAFAWFEQFPEIIPIWGFQSEAEVLELVQCLQHTPSLDQKALALIEADKQSLSGKFCRGCGYCLPCAADIDIPYVARMSLFLRRSPVQRHLTDTNRAKMARILDCANCNHCQEHCPYHLDVKTLLRENYDDYRSFL